MRAGSLNRRLIIKAFTESTDHGRPTQTWYTFATVWGSIDPLSGREYMLADKKTADTSVWIRIRYLAGLKPSFRIFSGSRKYLIEAVLNPKDDNRDLKLLCTELIE